MTGQTLSHYRLLAKLGEGGMGVVYKAQDLDLGRYAAVKLLHPGKASNEDRKARFVQEARAASALNHPNIVTIYEIGHDAGVDFIAMEYVEGRTLDALIPRGGMRLPEALRIATQVAEGLAKAHGAGIVHRDLKPSNVMVTADGLVKLLDFGLAKLTATAGITESDATRTAAALAPVSTEGSIAGTAAYMSPEQAEGRAIDARSDIFSFGAMLYEMLSGRRAFAGDSQIKVLAAVVSRETDPLTGVPHDVERTLARCLRKDPARRWQTAADLHVALAELREESDSGRMGPVAAPSRPRRMVWAAVAAGAVALAAFGVWRLRPQEPPPQPVRKVALTSFPGSESEPHLSPDGRQVVFIWDNDVPGGHDVYVKLVDSGEPLRLTQTPEREFNPRWSPDASRIAFLRSGAVYSVSPLGGSERKLLDGPAVAFDWRPDGQAIVMATPAGLVLADLNSGERRALTKASAEERPNSPSFSPDGASIAYIQPRSNQGQMDLTVISATGGPPRTLVGESGFNHFPAWTNDGREILYNRQWSAMLRVPAAGGNPVRVPESDDMAIGPNMARSAARVVYSKAIVDMNVWSVTPGQGAVAVVKSTYRDFSPAVSPDGRRLAFTSDRTGQWELWACGADGARQTQLTSFGKAIVDGARWSPDGKEIAFAALVDGNRDIYMVGAEGGTPRRLTREPSDEGRPRYSRDGSTLYFRSDRSGTPEIWAMAAGGGPARQITTGGGFDVQESADGADLYFTRGRFQLGLLRMRASGGEATAAPGLDAVRPGAWAITAAGVYWLREVEGAHQLVRTDTRSGKSESLLRIASPVWGLAPALSATRQGDRVFWHQSDSIGADLVLLDNFH